MPRPHCDSDTHTVLPCGQSSVGTPPSEFPLFRIWDAWVTHAPPMKDAWGTDCELYGYAAQKAPSELPRHPKPVCILHQPYLTPALHQLTPAMSYTSLHQPYTSHVTIPSPGPTRCQGQSLSASPACRSPWLASRSAAAPPSPSLPSFSLAPPSRSISYLGPRYMSPERLNGSVYNWAADVWSAGIITLEVEPPAPPLSLSLSHPSLRPSVPLSSLCLFFCPFSLVCRALSLTLDPFGRERV